MQRCKEISKVHPERSEGSFELSTICIELWKENAIYQYYLSVVRDIINNGFEALINQL